MFAPRADAVRLTASRMKQHLVRPLVVVLRPLRVRWRLARENNVF